MSETKTPTAQDIEAVRAMLVTHLMSGLNKTPETVRQVAMLLDMSDRVLDYAAACLSAEVEAETVPAPAPQVEPSAPVGTPVWHIAEAGGLAYIGEAVYSRHVLGAYRGHCIRYPDDGGRAHVNSGDGPGLAANIRAASASWNAAHPDLPPVIVPERFREGPQVEPPEDTRPEPPWRKPQPPQTPAERVAAMTNPQVEAFVTGEGVGPWGYAGRGERDRRRYCAGGYKHDAVARNGRCWKRDGMTLHSLETGDTTTPAGRMECTRRLAVHLMRETVS